MVQPMNTSQSLSAAAIRPTFKERSPGVELGILRVHPSGGLTFLIRMKKGARAERHGHPGGEETYVLSGRVRIVRRVDADGHAQPDAVLDAGDYLFAPPGEVHEGIADEDTTFLVVTPGGLTTDDKATGDAHDGRGTSAGRS